MVTVEAEEGWPLKAISGPPSSVTVVEAVAVQPLAAVTVTEYAPAARTEMLAVSAPVLHRYDPFWLATRITVGLAQVKIAGSGSMRTEGRLMSWLTPTLAVAEQPLPSLTVTEYVPATSTSAVLADWLSRPGPLN
jgi:hypothetical protein